MGVRGLVIGGIAAVGTIVGGAAIAGTGALDDHTERNASGEIVESGGLGALKIEVGDCVNFPDDPVIDSTGQELVVSVEGVPCANAHDAQAYAEFDISGIDVFTDAAVSTQAQNGCLARWTGAIGTDYRNDLKHDISYLTPTKQAWLANDRLVICFIVALPPGSVLTGSLLADDSGAGS